MNSSIEKTKDGLKNFLQELLDADEIIVSSSTHICKRVNKIDNKPCGGKDLNTFKKLQDYVFNEFYDYTSANRID